MTPGIVTARLEAVVRLRFRGPNGVESVVDGIVDTGFTGSLTIPILIAASLGMNQFSVGQARLADGSTCSFPIYKGELEWEGNFRTVLLSAMGDECLIRMQFMSGLDLRIQVRDRGAVEIG
jgi:clan AA aspartic protease